MILKENEVLLPPTEIYLSQASVSRTDLLTESMRKYGWKLDESPIDIVKMKDGKLITLDNTRVVSAYYAGIKVRAIIRSANDPLPPEFMKRFKTTKDGEPSTWGEAVCFRINNQNKPFRLFFPNGRKL